MTLPDPAARAAEAIKAAIRAACGPCGGTGTNGCSGSIDIVTREMAIDGGDPSLEGMAIDNRSPIQCEYCGRPMEAVDESIIRREFADQLAAVGRLQYAAKETVRWIEGMAGFSYGNLHQNDFATPELRKALSDPHLPTGAST